MGFTRLEGSAVYGAMTNRVAVTKMLTVQSVNGPDVTIIEGYQVPGLTNGDGAMRCVYLTNRAVLSGFTLTNGATLESGDSYYEQSGGGVWCESKAALVTNCTLVGNSAYYGAGACYGTLDHCALVGNSAVLWGGGAFDCTLNACIITGNSASEYGGGASESSLNNCMLQGNSTTYGGGADYSTLNNCTISGNLAFSDGGGAYEATLNNCTITGNSANNKGGGTCGGSPNNCTITGNSAGFGGGVSGGTLKNCIVYYNSAAAEGMQIMIMRLSTTAARSRCRLMEQATSRMNRPWPALRT